MNSSPAEENFRRVKLSTPQIKAALMDVPGAVKVVAIGLAIKEAGCVSFNLY